MRLDFLETIYKEYNRHFKEFGESPKRLYLNFEMYHLFWKQIAEEEKLNLILSEMQTEPKKFLGMEIIKDFKQWRIE